MRSLISETTDKIGEEVELKGWVHNRRDHGKLIFIDLRDRSGIVQLVFSPSSEIRESAGRLRLEWVIGVRGKVAERPAAMVNENILTGKIEILVSELEIIAEAKTPPFEIGSDGREISEEIRMKYRYLDLRRERLAGNLRNRHRVIKYMRDFLTNEGFVEIETPMLGRSTPEGARDYLVPSRLHSGKFYALPQSPQQYKQLLMVAGFERYFQIARCLRDEDPRGDRQPEFTQLDLEMSFTSEDEIMDLAGKLYLNLVKDLYPNKRIKLDKNNRIPRMTHKEAMEKYDSDKPDIRENKEDPDELAFLFVTDFPMFERKESENRWDAIHHPFTQPKVKNVDEFWQLFRENPAEILAKQYDFVLNGCEIGGGSMRIHDSRLLAAVFEAMGNKPEEIKDKFGHLLEALEFGAPPHGGMAPGIDRFLMILQNEPNIREVIAFPKTGDGRDLMTGAPAKVETRQLKELNIKTIE